MQTQYPLSQEQIQQFRKDGFIKLSQVATQQQMDSFRVIFNQVVERVSSKGDKQSRIDDYSKIFTQVTNLWKIEPSSREFIFNKKFAQIACKLMGVNHVRLYHDQALVKNPEAMKTPWHQDHFYWPIDSPNLVTMWIPLHDCPRTRGTMQFVKGSHNSEDIKHMPISEQSQAYFQSYIKENNASVQTFDLVAGDATFHYGRTLHCAHGNTEGKKREVMTVIFMEDGVKVLKEQQMNEFRKVDLSVFCPQIKCGEVANSELNPVLF